MADKDENKDKVVKAKKAEKVTDGSKYIETEPVIDEALDLAQRRARGRALRKNKSKIARGRKIAARKKASTETLKKRAGKKALKIVKDKLAGKKKISDMSPSQKIALEKRAKKIPSSRVKRIAKQILPDVRKGEVDRLKKRRGGKTKNESFEGGGAGDVGTDKLVSTYLGDTPGQDTMKKTKTRHHKMFDKNGNILHDKRFARYRDIPESAEALEEMTEVLAMNIAFDEMMNEEHNVELIESNTLMLNEAGEPVVTDKQLKIFEKAVDALFKKFNIDFKFTGHFGDRMADARNKPMITMADLANTFKKLYKKVVADGKTLAQHKNAEAVLKDGQNALNLPLAVSYNRRKDELVVALKTIMRKKNFHTPDKIIKV